MSPKAPLGMAIGHARLLLIAALASAIGCGGHALTPRGKEKGDCYPNGTCDLGLECFSNLCVRYGSADGGRSDATVDASGAAGSATTGSGVAGAAGTTGAAGVAGVAGMAGTTGKGGAAGTLGVAGTTGAGGASGAGGATGTGPGGSGGQGLAGTTGAAGTAGVGDGGAGGMTDAGAADVPAVCVDAGATSPAPSDEVTAAACGLTPATTTRAYSGYVIMKVSGLYTNSPGSPLEDPFYFVDAADTTISRGACPDSFRYNLASESDCVCSSECAQTSHRVADLLAQPYPAFNPSHEYTVKLNLNLGTGPEQRLHFGMADCGCSDNSGTHAIALWPATADSCLP